MTTIQSNLTVECKVNLGTSRQQKRSTTDRATPPTPPTVGHVPRLTRLMALAIRLQDLIERGEVRDYADLALLGHVTRARVTQIMNLLNLAPDIQEDILFLPLSDGRDAIKEWQVRPIAAELNWQHQWRIWTHLRTTSSGFLKPSSPPRR